MKKISQSASTWIVLLIFAICAVLYFFGFRITYAPTLENSWDAISACAGWAGVVASAIAVFVAIGIPKKIAEQQNKIALFDKRYSAFNTFAFLTSVIKQIVGENVSFPNKRMYLDNMIDTYKSISIIKELAVDCQNASDVYTRLFFKAGKIQYVFELAEMEIVIDFLLTASEYISNVYRGVAASDADLRVKYYRLNTEGLQEKLEVQLKL